MHGVQRPQDFEENGLGYNRSQYIVFGQERFLSTRAAVLYRRIL